MDIKDFKVLLKKYGANFSTWPNESEAQNFFDENKEAQREVEMENIIDYNLLKMQSMEVPSDLSRNIVNNVLTQRLDRKVIDEEVFKRKIESLIFSKLSIAAFILFLSILCWFSLQQGFKVSEEEVIPKFSHYFFNGVEGDPYGN